MIKRINRAILLVLLFVAVLILWKADVVTITHKIANLTQTNKDYNYILLKEINNVEKLESVEYHQVCEIIIDRQKTLEIFNYKINLPLTGRKLLLRGNGTVVAGIDFKKMSPITSQASTVFIAMPEAEIIHAYIDSESWEIIYNDTEIFAEIKDSEIVEKQAELINILKDEAIKNNILDKANQNARETITYILNNQGITKIIFQ